VDTFPTLALTAAHLFYRFTGCRYMQYGLEVKYYPTRVSGSDVIQTLTPRNNRQCRPRSSGRSGAAKRFWCTVNPKTVIHLYLGHIKREGSKYWGTSLRAHTGVETGGRGRIGPPHFLQSGGLAPLFCISYCVTNIVADNVYPCRYHMGRSSHG